MALHGPDHSATSSSPGDAAGGLFFTRSLIRALAQSMHVPQSVPTLRSLDTCLSVRFPASTERLMSPSVTAWQRQTYMALLPSCSVARLSGGGRSRRCPDRMPWRLLE